MNEELRKLLNTIIKEKGGSYKDYRLLMDKIGYHESRSNPKASQIGGGPGRGKYQFEVGDNRGGNTAVNRLRSYYNKNKLDIPKWVNDLPKSKSLDASKLKGYQQDILFLVDKMEHPKADFSKVIKGEQSTVDFWAQNHWSGHKKDREVRVKNITDDLEVFNKKDNVSTYKEPTTNLYEYTSNPVENIERASNQLAHGGSLKSNISQGEFNQFNEGGSHESNPHGGIPMGQGLNGKPNTVEEDETSFDFEDGKYIFSARLGFDEKLLKKSSSESNQFANGGKMDDCECGCPGKPPCKNDITQSKNKLSSKNFLLDYIKSDSYRDKLEKSNYKDVDSEIERRYNNLKYTNVKHINKPGDFLKKFKKNNLFKGSEFVKPENLDKYGEIILDYKQHSSDPSIKDYPIEDILSHEYSHALMNSKAGGYKPQYRKDSVTDFISSDLLNESDAKDIATRIIDTDDSDMHDLSTNEKKADLDAFKFILNRDGVYDARKEIFTKKHLKESEDSFIKKRLLKNFSEKDLIYLMNKIANINKSHNQNIKTV